MGGEHSVEGEGRAGRGNTAPNPHNDGPRGRRRRRRIAVRDMAAVLRSGFLQQMNVFHSCQLDGACSTRCPASYMRMSLRGGSSSRVRSMPARRPILLLCRSSMDDRVADEEYMKVGRVADQPTYAAWLHGSTVTSVTVFLCSYNVAVFPCRSMTN